MRFRLFLVTLFSAVLLSGSASALTTTYHVHNNGLGLSNGHACLSSAGSGSCSDEQKFSIDSTFAVAGSFTFDDALNTLDINLTLATATMTGSHDGVSEVVFTNVNYVIAGMSAIASGNQLFGIGTASGSITGDYEQTDGISTLLGPSAIAPMSSVFSAFSCSNLDIPAALCGLTVGATLRDFNLNIGTSGSPDSFDFVQTFVFNVTVPEPGTASLLALGLLTLGLRRHRR